MDLAQEIKSFLTESYPNINVQVKPLEAEPDKLCVYFIEEKFALIYPMQRYHYLIHLLPPELVAQKLQNTIWFELAPGEKPEDLIYPDEQLIEEITPDVFSYLIKTKFFEKLDNKFCLPETSEEKAICFGDYRNSKEILLKNGFYENEFFDVFHVLMSKGGYCDCEILLNVFSESNFGKTFRQTRNTNNSRA